MDWTRGYFTAGGYTFGHYPETMPSRLAFNALLYGVATQTKNFRYLDLGCGQGLNLILAASMHPESAFVGVDFMPEHIAHARALAEASGLSNVQFIEADFVELANDLVQLGDGFDYAVAHGITTWISTEARLALYSIVGRVLKPNGVFYNSYNTLPGWLTMTPFQFMVLHEQKKNSGAKALENARALFQQMKDAQATVFSVLPTLPARLDKLSEQDPAYLVQEYNNNHWRPQWITVVMDETSKFKLEYLGTATLTEAFEQNYPAKLRELILQSIDIASRELTRDISLNQTFRRDIYIKGKKRLWPLDQSNLIEGLEFVLNPFRQAPKEGEPFPFSSGGLDIKGLYEPYMKLLTLIKGHGGSMSIRDITRQYGASLTEIAQMGALLLHGGWLLLKNPLVREAKKTCARLNSQIFRDVRHGAPYRYVASAVTGSALAANEIEMLLLSARGEKLSETQQIDFVQKSLKQLGRSLMQDGKPVSDETALRTLLTNSVRNFNGSLSNWETLEV